MALVSLIEDEMVDGVFDIWIDTFRIPVLHPLHLGLYSSGHHNVSKLTTQADLNEVLTLIITSEDWRDIVIFYDDTFGKKCEKQITTSTAGADSIRFFFLWLPPFEKC